MDVTVSLDDDLTNGRDEEQIIHDMKRAFFLYYYVTARFSLGEFADAMNMPLLEARDWLHERGIPTSRTIRDPELAQAVEQDRDAFLRSLDTSS